MTKPFRTVAANAFTVTIADPFFLVLHLTMLVVAAIMTTLPGFTDGEHVRLLRDQSLALFFIVGCLAVVFGMIRAVTDDFRRGAGAVLLSRPIGPFGLLLGKWTGVMGAVAILAVTGAVSAIWAAELAGDEHGLSTAGLMTYFGAILLAVVGTGIRHYLLRGSFPTWANLFLPVAIIAGFCLRLALNDRPGAFDWPALQGVTLLFLALAAFAAIVLPVALLLDSALVLGVGIALFFLGLLSNYLIRSAVAADSLGRMLIAIMPNWQIYWVADRLAEGVPVPAGYFISCGIHAAGFVALFTTIAAVVLSRMEIRQ